MRIEDMPRPWLLAAVTGVPMAELLERAEQEAEVPEAAWANALRDEDERLAESERRAARSHRNRVVYLPAWQ